MTKQEAIEQMQKGKKVTHRFFTNDEWIESNLHGTMLFLSGISHCSANEFWRDRTDESWNSDWEIFN